MMEMITFVLVVSVVGYTLTLIMQPGEILDFIPAGVFRLTKLMTAMKVLQCEKCISGQIALWGYLIKWWGEYNFWDHFLVVMFSIFCAHAIGKFFETN